MPAYVPDRPAMLELQGLRAGRPTSHRHGRAWQDTLHFLLGHNLPVIVSTSVDKQPTATSADYYFAYKRSPGARSLLIVVELHEPAAEGAYCTVDASIVGFAPAYLYLPQSNVTTAGDLRGALNLIPQFGDWADVTQFADFLNVEELTVGALSWVRVRWTNVAGTTHGISKIHAIEVPRATLAQDSSDAGVDNAWPFTGNKLYDGTSSTPDGFVRLLSQIDLARTDWRTYFQVATVEANADAWALGASVGVFANVLFGRSSQPIWTTRARRLYATTTNNQKKLVCRYTTGSAVDGATLRLIATSRTTGTVVTTDVTLPASAGWSASAETTAAIPCDGTDQEVTLKFQFKTAGAAALKLSTIALYDAET